VVQITTWVVRKKSQEEISQGGQYPRAGAACNANDPRAQELMLLGPGIIDLSRSLS